MGNFLYKKQIVKNQVCDQYKEDLLVGHAMEDLCVFCSDDNVQVRIGTHKSRADLPRSHQSKVPSLLVDPVITGIYQQLQINDTEPVLNTKVKFGDLTLLVRQKWIDLKNEIILAERADKIHKIVFLQGTSGRGKSAFVYYLIYCILIQAKAEKKRKLNHGSEAIVCYARNDSCDVRTTVTNNVLTLDGPTTATIIPPDVLYYIGDMKEDIYQPKLAHRVTMVVSSDEADNPEFRKHVRHAGVHGLTRTMLSPTIEEIHMMFSTTFTPEEITFRIAVVGCNPREIKMNCDSIIINPDFKQVVTNAAEQVLSVIEEENPAKFSWIMGVVMQAIDAATVDVGKKKIAMNSLFREYIEAPPIEGVDTKRYISVYTSSFMFFLAGMIRDKFANDPLKVLKTLFGSSGIGHCHEYDAHNIKI